MRNAFNIKSTPLEIKFLKRKKIRKQRTRWKYFLPILRYEWKFHPLGVGHIRSWCENGIGQRRRVLCEFSQKLSTFKK